MIQNEMSINHDKNLKLKRIKSLVIYECVNTILGNNHNIIFR